MNATLGTAGVVLGVAASALGIVTLAVGLRRQRPQLLETGWSYSLLVLLGAVVSVVAMQRALITRDFSVSFVHDHGSSRTPPLFNVATMWSALEGSILLWALILAGFTVHVARKFRKRLSDPLVGVALLTMLVVCLFFFLLMLGPANPFTTVTVAAGYDGPGPNPLLQEHILMAVHPPMLYLGYVGFTVPFAFAIAALATGRLGEGWLVETRRATLLAWGFLTVGIALGAWWSYEVLGWGGYWGWDPVENASLLPWLTGTAYLHSVMVQERRGMLRVWNLSLLCATFSLTILGTFLTRSGVLESVHAFSDSDIGAWLLSFFALTVAVTLGLIGWRGDRLRSPGRIDSPLSREGAFLANNVLFAGFAFVVLLGTVFPLRGRGAQRPRGHGRSAVLQPHDRADRHRAAVHHGGGAGAAVAQGVGRAALAAAAVAGVGRRDRGGGHRGARRPRARHRADVRPGRLRRRRRPAAGGAGDPAAGLARAGRSHQRRHGRAPRRGDHRGGHRHQRPLPAARSRRATSPGRPGVVGGHEITYLRTDVVEERNRTATKVSVQVDGGQVYRPALSQYAGFGTLIGTPSVKTGLREDVYLTVDPPAARTVSDEVTLRVIIQPMALWLWIGGGDDGGRHAAGRLAGPPPPAHRPGVGSGRGRRPCPRARPSSRWARR